MLRLVTIFLAMNVSNAFSIMSSRSISTTLSKVEVANPFTRHLDTRLFAEETPEETPVTEEEQPSKTDSSSTDILNSPAFLKRKIDVLNSDIAAVDEKLSEANALYEANKAEWGPQLESLSKEVSYLYSFRYYIISIHYCLLVR